MISFLPVILILRSSIPYYLNAAVISLLLFLLLVDNNQELISDLRFAITNSAYLSYTESCCTQAILYRSSSIPPIIQQLFNIPTKIGHAKDHIIDQSTFISRMADQNLFLHIGYFSAVRQNFVDFPQRGG